MSVGSPTAGTWSSSQWRPDNEFETDRWVELNAVAFLAAGHRNALDSGRARQERDADRVAGVGRARHDGDVVAGDREFAWNRRDGSLRVAKVVETGDELPLADRLPLSQHERSRVDARQRPLLLVVQSRVDQSGVGDVGEHEAADHGDRQDADGGQHVPHARGSGSPAACPWPTRDSPLTAAL